MQPNEELLKKYRKLQLGVFSRKNSAFLAPLLCSLKVEFKEPKEIGQEDYLMGVAGDSITINPNHLLQLNQSDGVFILEHELWHIARLHHQRMGNRDPDIWNKACDHVINLAMIADGSSCSIKGLWDKRFRGKNEEEVYSILMSEVEHNKPMPDAGDTNQPSGAPSDSDESSNSNSQNDSQNDSGSSSSAASSEMPQNGFSGDLLPASSTQVANTAQTVAKLKQMVQMTNPELCRDPGSALGQMMRMWEKLLEPKLPWENILHNCMKDLMPKSKLSWKRRNRRFCDIHLPSMVDAQNKLSNLVYAVDTSGSITPEQLDRINSELKYIHDKVKPKLLTVIQFDTKIRHEDKFKADDLFENIELHGGGGTSYQPVKEYVDNLPTRPEGLIIFTDLYAYPMEKLEDESIPVFWVAVNTDVTAEQIPFGDYIPVEV